MVNKRLRIAYMGTPDFSVPALEALIQSEHDVVAVYTQPPRPKGRGQKIQLSPVHKLAERHDIPVFVPKSLKKDKDAQAIFASLDLDVAVVAAYGLILPNVILEAPKYGCLNIHASLLPRWRGASPIQHAIWKGDMESGITIMQMDVGLDTGPMILRSSIEITPHTTAQMLHDDLSVLGAEMSCEVLDKLARDGRLGMEVQDDNLSCYAPMLRKDNGAVDWSKTSAEIDRQIRALNPWPGVRARVDGKYLKIIEAVPVAGVFEGDVGTLVDRDGVVICGGNTGLQLKIVQPENAKKMDVVSAINGGHLSLETVFE